MPMNTGSHRVGRLASRRASARGLTLISSLLEDVSTMKEAPAQPAVATARIARRVAALRQRRDLSLQALSQRSHVSRSMISLIERGQSSPTAVVLERLAAGLGVALASLFDDDAAPPSPLSRRDAQLQWRDPASGYVRRNLSPPNHPSPLQLVAVELPAGASVMYDGTPQRTEMHQQVLVLDGVVEAHSGPERHRLEAGDCLAMRLDRHHGFRNPGRRTARYIVAIVTA
jgi:transcriptional regulator with XRE-family HTH domain